MVRAQIEKQRLIDVFKEKYADDELLKKYYVNLFPEYWSFLLTEFHLLNCVAHIENHVIDCLLELGRVFIHQ